MRASLVAPLVLAFSIAASGVAHATSIVDLQLVGEGHTIAYSLPESGVIADHPHGVTWGLSGPATFDGVGGYTESGLYYLPFPGLPSIILTVTPSSLGQLVFYGPSVLSATVIPISDPSPTHPDDLLVSFVAGTYTMQRSSSGSFLNPTAPYTLTIKDEASPIPEPGTGVLLATGAMAGLLAAGLRRSGFRVGLAR